MKITDLTPEVRQKIADLLELGSDAVLRHIQTGRRKASAAMAVRIEKAAKRVGVDLPRESLCETCRKCDLAKAARKLDQ
jgi:hypothetical protein